jgi:Uncharacterized protein conserved in bacteria
MSNDNIFREVDEELRSDRMRRFWRQFGPFVIGGAIAVVLVVAVNEGWTWWRNSNAAASSDRLYAAFDLAEGGDVDAARGALDDLVANGSGGYPTLARFRSAGLLAESGDTAGAAAAYDALATGESNPRLREVALLLAASLLVDTATPADIEGRVGGIAVEGNPLRNAAREVIGLSQYRAGNTEAAQAAFEAIVNDPMTQNNQRQRVSFYLAQLLAEGAVAPEAEAAAAEEGETSPATEEAPAAE